MLHIRLVKKNQNKLRPLRPRECNECVCIRHVGEWDARHQKTWSQESWRVSSRTICSVFTTFVLVHAGQDGLSCGEEARRWESIFRDNRCGSRINVTVYGREDILQAETPPAIVALKTVPAVDWPLSEFVYRVTVTWTLCFFCPHFVVWNLDFTDKVLMNIWL